MDPVTILTITGAALKVLVNVKKVSEKIAEYLVAADKVYDSLADLQRELDSLYGDLDNVNTICHDPDFQPTAEIPAERSQSNIFARLQKNLESCTITVDGLYDLIAEIDPGGSRGFINRAFALRRLQERADDLALFRAEIQTHRSSMHLSVSALTFCMETQSIRLNAKAGKLMNIKMNKLTNVIESQSVEQKKLTTLVEKQSSELQRLRKGLSTDQRQMTREDTQMLRDMEKIHESTIILKRRATIYGKSSSSTKIDKSDSSFADPVQNKDSELGSSESNAEHLQSLLKQVPSAPQSPVNYSVSTKPPPLPPRVISAPPMNPAALMSTADSNNLAQSSIATSSPFKEDRPEDTDRAGSDAAHAQPATSPLLSFKDFEQLMSSTITHAEVRKRNPTKPFKEEDFINIRSLLDQVGKTRWSERPRTYLILRLIDEVQAMDGFVLEGLKDVQIPYTEERLPKCLSSPGSRHAFIQTQSLVMSTRGSDLVSGGRHRHFNSSADLHFTVIRNLGKGGQGIVDLVRSHLSSHEYARKRIFRTRTFSRNKETLAMFEKEIHNLKRLDNIHLVKLVGSYTDPRYVGLIMDPVADCDLKDYLMITPFPKENLSLLKCFFGCLASAVKYLHEQKCRHKDIKPGNILVKDRTILITDFGTSLDWTDHEADSTTGPPMSYTNVYAAPEVAKAKSRGNAADIWSLGCVFLEIITVLKGKTPYDRKRFFGQSGTRSPCFHDNSATITTWIATLYENSPEDQLPLAWIRRMMLEEPTERIDATELLNEILSTSRTQRYCGPCCGDCLDSDEESWHGSETDEEFEDRDSSKVSPAVTWNSISSIMSPQSPGHILEASSEACSPIRLRSPQLLESPSQQKFQPLKQSLPPGELSGEDHCRQAPPVLPAGPPPRPPKPARFSLTDLQNSEQLGKPTLIPFTANNPALDTHLSNLRSQGNGQLENYIEETLQATARTGNYSTPLHHAVRFHDAQLARLLVKIILDKSNIINVVDTDLNSPLHYAVKLKRLLLVDYLMKQNASVSLTNMEGQTALHMAVKARHASIVSVLLRLSQSAIVDLRDNSGQTALHLACADGYTDIVSILLDNAAATDLLDKASRTPEMVSHVDAVEEISELMIQARESNSPDGGISSLRASMEPKVHSPITERPPPYDASTSSAEMCRCEVCKLLDLSSKMEDAALEDGIRCTCIDCLERLAKATVSDFELIRNTPFGCSCDKCFKSNSTLSCLREQGVESVANVGENEYRQGGFFDDIDLAVSDAECKEELQMDGNRPPCECNSCTVCTNRVRVCAVTLSEGDFRKISYRVDPNKTLQTAMKKFALIPDIVDVILFLLDNGADIETRDHQDRTLLHLAAKHGNVALAQLLVYRGADLNAERLDRFSKGDGWTPLSYAINDGRDTITYLLLQYGARVDDLSSYKSRRTLLHDLIDPAWRNLWMLRMLLRNHPNLEVVDENSSTPLHFAIMNCDLETTTILLNAGSYVEAPGKDGYKPLAFAIQYRDDEMVRLLLRFDANIHCRCGPCPNALLYAAQCGGWAVLDEILRNEPLSSDIFSSDSEGRTIFHHFAQGAQIRDEIPSMLDLLSENGADPNAQDVNGNTPLHLAVVAGGLMMVSDLVENGANEHARNRAGKTPLDLAKAKRNREMVNLLGGELKRRWFRKS